MSVDPILPLTIRVRAEPGQGLEPCRIRLEDMQGNAVHRGPLSSVASLLRERVYRYYEGTRSIWGRAL